MASLGQHRTLPLTLAALVAFAANSLLCRAALESAAVDATTFTSVRLVSGALLLALLVRARAGRIQGGSWGAAFALFAYAIAFSFAYLRIGAGIGALVLFGCVQITMVGSALGRGERLGGAQWFGLALALGGLGWLTVPGASAPDALGVASMALAGVAWGVYSLLGRGSTRPLASTAHNFLLSLPLAVGASAIAHASYHASLRGFALAVASGALASGLGYTIWYAALPKLSRSGAAIAQLVVPVLAAIGGVLLLGESPNPRLAAGGIFILGGVALAIRGRRT